MIFPIKDLIEKVSKKSVYHNIYIRLKNRLKFFFFSA